MGERHWPVDQVYLYLQPVDFRKSINGLSALVELEMSLDPFMPALFVFCNRQRDKVKLLYWERNGFVLWYKRLEKQRFCWPLARGNDVRQLNALRERDNVIHILHEKLRLVGAKTYGVRSEQRSNDPQADLFNEADSLAQDADKDDLEASSASADQPDGHTSESQSADTETITYERRKRPGRRALPEALPRVEIELDIPESDKVCSCGCQKSRIGSDSNEQLEIIPAKLFVTRYLRHKYACPKCEDGVQIAERQPAMIPKSNAGPGLLAYVVTAKYQDALPLYRQEKIFQRHGVHLTRQTLANWIIKCSQALDPLLEQMERAMRSAPVILMDETTVQVNKEEGKAPGSQSFMWIRRALAPPDDENRHGKDITLYHYSRSRSGEVAAALLKDYHGALMSDAYAGYNRVARAQQLAHALCWAHARRKFVDAEKSLPKGKK